MALKESIGDRFCNLEIIGFAPKRKNRNIRIIVRCDCGKEKEIYAVNFRNKSTSSCGCLSKKVNHDRLWTGYEEISGVYWYDLKRGAKSRNLEFTISIESAWKKFIEQSKKCILSGQPIKFVARSKEQTASLDRIDSSKGYIEGNIQWVHKDINKLKGNFTDQKFIELCTKVYFKNSWGE